MSSQHLIKSGTQENMIMIFKKAIPEDLRLLPNKDYNLAGQFIGVNKTEFNTPNQPMCRFWIPEIEYHRAESAARCSYGANRSTAAKHSKVEHDPNNPLHYLSGPREHTPSPIDYEILKPFFCWLPTKLIKKTFENSTQYGTLPQSEHSTV